MRFTQRTDLRARLGRAAAVLLALLPLVSAMPASADPNATSCQGFGATTAGGQGGSVYHVTTLDDSGPGSLRDALSQGNRIVVFDVAGDIVLESDITVEAASITVDGASAPAPGISIKNRGLVLSGARDVILKSVRIRGAAASGIHIASDTSNIVVDHVSVSGSAMLNVAVDNARDITICWSILGSTSEPAHNAIIANGASRVSLHNNVLIGSEAGNPTAFVNEAGTSAASTTLDMRNNIVWGSGFGTVVYNGATANIVANLFSSDPAGPQTRQANALTVCSGNCEGAPISNGRAYVLDNVSGTPATDLNAQGTEPAPFPAPPLAGEVSACSLTSVVLADAGARPLDARDTQALATLAAPAACQCDLRVDSLTVPASAVVGEPFSVTDTTANIGTGEAASTVTQFYISARSTLDETAVAIGSRTVPLLASGATDTATTLVTIPNGVGASCNYYILAKANATSVGDEPITTNNVRVQAIKVCPDLLVETLSTPLSAAPGSMIDIAHTVRNRGQSAAGASTLKFYVSTGPTVDATAIQLGSPRDVPRLAAGATDVGTTSVPLPSTVGTASLYYILAVLDEPITALPNGIYGEYDEGNNLKWFKIKIGPDLHVSALSTTGTAVPGGSISVQDTTRNRGVSRSPASVTKFYLGTTTTFDPSSPLLGSRAVPALDAAATHLASTTVTIPTNLGSAGTYYLFGVADGGHEVPEPDEVNNSTTYVVVTMGPDLHVSALSAPATAVAGTSITVQDTTRNRGVSPAPASLTAFYLSTTTTFNASGAIPLGSHAVPGLNAGATHPATTTLNIPTSHANHKIGVAGTYYLFVIADDGAMVAEPDEANNSTTYAVVKIGPDLHISALSTTGTPVAGGNFSVQDTTRNRGVSASPASVTTFYLSTTTTLDASAQLLGNRTVPALEAGLTSTMTTTLNIPATVKPANYLLAVADGEDTVAEPLESNNVGYAILKIGPDLHISALSAPTTAIAGGSITVQNTTRNRGVSAAPPSVTAFYLSTTTTFSAPTAIPLGSRAVPALAAAATDPNTTTLNIPTDHANHPVGMAGTYYLFAIADDSAIMAEPDEANNSTTYAVVKIGPDLHISALSTGAATAVPGGPPITVQDTTRNRGVSAAPPSRTNFYLSPTATYNR